MKKISAVIITIGVVLTLAILLIGAGSKVYSGEEAAADSSSRRMGKITDLTDEQKEQIKEIKKKYSLKIDNLKFEIKKKRFDMAEELRKENPDRNKLDNLIDQIVENQRKLQKLILDEYFEIRQILNPSQRKFYNHLIIRMLLKGR